MRLFRFVCTLGLFAMVVAFAHDHAHHSHATQSTPSQAILDSMHAPMMAQAPSESSNPEVDYLRDMIPHHQGAVDSATLLLPHITNDELKTLAQNIIRSQTKEIAEFRALLDSGALSGTKLSSSQYQEFLKANKQAMDTMMQQMSAVKPTDDVQRDFVRAMIAHHNGAIKTSKIILSYTKDSQVRTIARSIIADQESEVSLMQKLLTRL